ncbi:SAM-dependent methyltransferase [Akkermansiaceae bacterium]|nr:SAM-dependent methyltransferase [Akkermansiaceae bacterium]
MITERGAMPFPEYLEMALYDPELGYYAKTGGQVGRGGDFYTSVSVGDLFGRLLARRFAAGWDDAGRPGAWRILEIGAHDGKLAADILGELRGIRPDAWDALRYAIAEPLPLLRNLQAERLAEFTEKLNIVADPGGLAAEPLPGFAFGNEILDALPFHLIEMRSGKWMELHVVATGGQLGYRPREIEEGSALSARLVELGNDFPEGYRTEMRTNFLDFLTPIAAGMEGGTMLFTDYGFAAPEYYDRHRTTGTLRTFSSHKAGEDALEAPGEKDITAHVDFTDLAHAAGSLGFMPRVFSNQGSYLTHLAKPLMLEGGLDDRKSIAQFQSLTHPAPNWASFHAIELGKNADTPPEVRHRLAL